MSRTDVHQPVHVVYPGAFNPPHESYRSTLQSSSVHELRHQLKKLRKRCPQPGDSYAGFTVLGTITVKLRYGLDKTTPRDLCFRVPAKRWLDQDKFAKVIDHKITLSGIKSTLERQAQVAALEKAFFSIKKLPNKLNQDFLTQKHKSGDGIVAYEIRRDESARVLHRHGVDIPIVNYVELEHLVVRGPNVHSRTESENREWELSAEEWRDCNKHWPSHRDDDYDRRGRESRFDRHANARMLKRAASRGDDVSELDYR